MYLITVFFCQFSQSAFNQSLFQGCKLSAKITNAGLRFVPIASEKGNDTRMISPE